MSNGSRLVLILGTLRNSCYLIQPAVHTELLELSVSSSFDNSKGFQKFYMFRYSTKCNITCNKHERLKKPVSISKGLV